MGNSTSTLPVTSVLNFNLDQKITEPRAQINHGATDATAHLLLAVNQSCHQKLSRHLFNHADRLHREALSQPFIQSWMANCCSKQHMPPLAELIIFHRANRQHHSLPNHHVGQLSALRWPVAILPLPSKCIHPQASPRLEAGALLTTAADDHR